MNPQANQLKFPKRELHVSRGQGHGKKVLHLIAISREKWRKVLVYKDREKEQEKLPGPFLGLKKKHQ